MNMLRMFWCWCWGTFITETLQWLWFINCTLWHINANLYFRRFFPGTNMLKISGVDVRAHSLQKHCNDAGTTHCDLSIAQYMIARLKPSNGIYSRGQRQSDTLVYTSSPHWLVPISISEDSSLVWTCWGCSGVNVGHIRHRNIAMMLGRHTVIYQLHTMSYQSIMDCCTIYDTPAKTK